MCSRVIQAINLGSVCDSNLLLRARQCRRTSSCLPTSPPYSRRILDNRAALWLYHRPIAGAAFEMPLLINRLQSSKFSLMGVDAARELHVASLLRRVRCCGSREYHRGSCHRSDDESRPQPFLAAMAMAKCAEGEKPPLKMAVSAPLWGYKEKVWGVPHCFA
jgi:hypothetical protein